jgi:DNA-binding transcriptional MerR regulator
MDEINTPSDQVTELPSEHVGYSGRKAAEVVGISYRQLDYWARTDLVRPSLAEARGSGSRRLYSYRDLLELKVIKTLLDAGLKLESVRQVFSYMRDQLGEDISSANLVISGCSSVLVRSGEELIDVLQQGQGVLNVLALAGVKDEIDARILELRPLSNAADGSGRSISVAEIERSTGTAP